MDISVILCSYNRCQNLVKALDSIVASVLPNSVQWEILVVDNNSNDRTHEVVEDFCRRYPGRVRYVFESRPGKSYALNRGIGEAQGEILAFTDDDAIVEPTWLQNLTQSLCHNEWTGAAGRIVLEWPSSLPPWLSTQGPHSRHCFPGFDQGNDAKELVGPPFGANMAFKRIVFEKYGTFRTDLGPSPSPEIPSPSEDTEFARRLIAGGERLHYEPSAVVHHPVPEERISKEHILKWRFDLGRANIRALGVSPGTQWFIAGIPLYLFRRLAAWTLRWMVSLEPAQRFSSKVAVWQEAGEIVECRRQWRNRKRERNCDVQA